jgi:hypothetical protein
LGNLKIYPDLVKVPVNFFTFPTNFQKALKRAFSILMMIAVMLPALTRVGVLADYVIHREYIVNVLCVNKREPLVMCNGKCYLSKQWKKADEQEHKQAPKNVKEKAPVLYCQYRMAIDFFLVPCVEEHLPSIGYSRSFLPSAFLEDIFRPPSARMV